MTTTELIKILKDHEFGGKTGASRQISLCVNDEYYIPMPEFKLDGLTDGIGRVGETLFLSINGNVLKEKS